MAIAQGLSSDQKNGLRDYIFLHNFLLPTQKKKRHSYISGMATIGFTEVQNIIDYSFRSISFLVLALTAAGADEGNHDGNRKLAQLGELLIELLLADNAFTAGFSRGEIYSQA